MGHYSIQTAAQISGISDACIRAWEKRYNSVIPARNNSNHRLYSDEDIERLTLFNKLTSMGMKISQISNLGTDELKTIYLSVTKKKFGDLEQSVKKPAVPYFQSLYIIEESFNAKRFDVAYHEIKKVIDSSDSKDLALTFFPAMEGLCQSWKDKKYIDVPEVQAFEKYIHHLAVQKALREAQYVRNIKSIAVSLPSSKNKMADSGLELLLSSHRIENYLFSNEVQPDFLYPLVKVIRPEFIFVVGDLAETEVLEMNAKITDIHSAKVIIYNQKIPLLKHADASEIKNVQFFSNVFEIDQYLNNSL